ncbi:MAG: hypothetical protein ABI623_06090, partial [bacterium]
MSELDDAQERRKKSGEFLRLADKLYKTSDFEGALKLVAQATDADPDNPYALAYRERVEYAIEQRNEKNAPASTTSVSSQSPSPGPQNPLSREEQLRAAQQILSRERGTQEPHIPSSKVTGQSPKEQSVPEPSKVELNQQELQLIESIRKAGEDERRFSEESRSMMEAEL